MDTDLGPPVELKVRIRAPAVGALGPLGRVTARIAGRATHGEPPHVLTTLALHRRLFRRWLPFAAGLLRGTELPRADVELVILRTAWNCASWYEWAHHVTLAAAAGLDEGTALQVAQGAAAPGWSPRQAALLRGTDELHDLRVISDATWEKLADTFSDTQLLELCLIVGHYEMLAMTLNSLGVEPEATTLSRLGPDASAATRTLRRMLGARRGHVLSVHRTSAGAG